MYYSWKKIKQYLSLSRVNLVIISYALMLLGLIFVTEKTYSLVIENPSISNGSCPGNVSPKINARNKIIIIINGKLEESYFLKTLKKQKFFLINLVTSNSKVSEEKAKDYYDEIIVQDKTSEILKSLKILIENKGLILGEVYALQESDTELADVIKEAFSKQFNGKAFRRQNSDKLTAINHLTKLLGNRTENQNLLVEDFTKEISKQSLPCTVKVITPQKTLATYYIGKTSDVNSILDNVKTYEASNIKLWIQPYRENLYRLQIVSFNNKVIPLALWHEKIDIKGHKAQNSISTLVNLKDFSIISEDKLSELSQRLAKGAYLSHGTAEFVLAFHKDQIEIVDYNLTLPNLNQMEVMERIIGYSPISYHLHQVVTGTEPYLAKKDFKNIIKVNLHLSSKNDLLKLSNMPTFYRYYSSNQETENTPLVGELYLTHTDKNLVTASYSAIKNTEKLLSNPMFLSHSANHIVNFYREATIKQKSKNNIENKGKHQSGEVGEALKNLHHESQHIPRYIKPLGSKASIQDIMKYYIDIYDLYILHGKAPGTKITPMNTGNPAFLPFPPIVENLRKSLGENLITYARYSMQVPTTEFISKISSYCQEEKILAPNQKLETNNVVIGHGSTNLYYLALKSIIRNKGDIVLVTRPTYGLFIDPIYTAGGEVGFIDISENDGWKVHPEKLYKTIHFYNERAFNNYILTTFIKEYENFIHAMKVFNLDKEKIPSLPNIDEITDLKIFDQYIEKLNTFIETISDPLVNKDELKFSFSPRVKAFYHMNPHNPTGAVYTKEDLREIAAVIRDHPGIYIIDDLAHWGVLYEKIVPATMASMDGMFDKTLTLMSLSKSYCVPGLRTGVAIGTSEIISEMQYRLLNSSSSASLPAMIALDAVFSAPKKERDNYLNSNSQEYLFRRDLMKVLVDGIHQTNITEEQKIKIYQLILENEYKVGKPFDKKLINLLLSGMPLVRTLTKPKGCFFHLLDISKLIGAKIADHAPFQTATDVRNAIFSICNIDMVPGEISGNFFNYSLRMSFSLAPEQIYNACKSINLFIGNYIIKYNQQLISKNCSSLELKKIEVLDESIFNKALTRLYLNQVLQKLMKEHERIANLNIHQNSSRIQWYKDKIIETKKLIKGMLDHSSNKVILKNLSDYIEKNKDWLPKYIPDFEQLNTCIQAFKA
ncbi:MAG: pyridoxal phosphate-dependent aminotransferase [Candidatus Paracaedimonas acanthamoebae]|uniref:aspartate transaminase n=1 Tax=Candidatus Paracaedimonas acanthamoebae TaxID=244581 RepID=A0A8J7TTT9_9PROT|nr:pyridoxal phosphate-dependent aminotransferase [Candidatus Paracaedimonas acanthamoebae]